MSKWVATLAVVGFLGGCASGGYSGSGFSSARDLSSITPPKVSYDTIGDWRIGCIVISEVSDIEKCSAATSGYYVTQTGKAYSGKEARFSVYYLNESGPFIGFGRKQGFPGRSRTLRMDDGEPTTIGEKSVIRNEVITKLLASEEVLAGHFTWPSGGEYVRAPLDDFNAAWDALQDIRK